MINNHGNISPDYPAFITTRDTAVIRTRLDEICSLEAAAFTPPWKRSDFTGELDSPASRYMVLLAGDTCAGYLFAQAALDEISLNKICIAANMRGRGLGSRLLDGFITAVRGTCTKMFLEVKHTNTPAIRLYEHAGFHVNRIRKGIYAGGEDGIEMALDITP